MNTNQSNNNPEDDHTKEQLSQIDKENLVINDISETASLVNETELNENEDKRKDSLNEIKGNRKEQMSYLQIGIWINVVLYFFIAILVIIYQ